MSDNKFIKRLKGEQTAKSVLEIKNEAAKTSFANMPQGTSNAIDVFSDHRGNATAVLNGTTNWKISNSDLLLVDVVSGDGQDFTSTYSVSGTGLWVNASYTFPSTGDPRHPVAMVFNPSTKWVLKVCGDNLIVDGGSTVDFTMLVKIGTSNVYSKNFTIRESAGQFSKEFVIDFGEANSNVIKAGGLSTLTVHLLCGTANASARIYNGMTVLTCLQRKVDASAVSNSSANVEDVLDGNIIPSDYFSNPEFIDQVEDGEDAYAVFTRDGDDVNLSGWTPKEEIARKEEIIVKSDTIPNASADLVGSVYQYVGETSQTYEHGYIYECVAETETDNLILFNPVGTGKLGFDYAHHSVYELFERIAAILGTFTAEDVVSGSFTLDKINELWYIDGYDANGNALFTNFTVSGTGDEYSFDAYGFVYIVPFPDDFENGHKENFSIVQESHSIYSWNRIDVQPTTQIIDNLTSTSTTAALSANQGKVLNDRIDDVSGRGRYLSLWNCATGLAETNPPESPYTYKAGDYFVVGTVSSADPAVNYKPDGSSYTTGTASTTVETNEVSVNDTYFYDGTVWKLQSNAQKEVSFSALAGSPYDNTNLSDALNAKQNVFQVDPLPTPSVSEDGKIYQYVGETIRTKHEFITGEQGERTGTLSGRVGDTSTLRTKLASINTELGMDCDRLKFVVVSNTSGYYFDVYACEGETETLYEENTNTTATYGIYIDVVGSSAVGTYIYFDMIFDDEYNYSGNFYKCFKRVVIGEKPSAMYVTITNLDLVNSKIAEANETFDITTAKLKFVLTMMGNSQFTVYAVEGDGTEHLMQADINTGNLPTTFGVRIVQIGEWTVGMYMELEYQYYWNEVLELAHLSDVELKDLEDGQALIYDATSDKWVNGNGGVSATYDAITKTITFA